MEGLISDFISEAREGLEMLDSELVRFEQQPDDPATLSGIFRLVHTIKGTCGFLGLVRLQAIAHAAENVLGAFRDGLLAVSPAAVSAVLDTVDAIRVIVEELALTGVEPEGDDQALISRLEAVLTPPTPAPEASAPPPAPARPLIERLGGDATLDSAAEIVAGRLFSDEILSGAWLECGEIRLQGLLRDGLCAIARGQGPSVVLARSLADLAARGAAAEAVIDLVPAALADLEVEAEAIEALMTRILPVDPVVEPFISDAREPADLEVKAAGAAAPEPAPAVALPEISAPEPPPAPTPRAAAVGAAEGRPDNEGSGPAQTIRVSVDALEHLMTVVSELVLIRNQLIQTLRLQPESPFAAPLNRLNQVTSELQEGVMTTRMQPISGAWAKLPRLVRDLAQELGKSIDLSMSGQDTELDRQVLELIKDPLTHMIRNAADHGLESPAERLAAGKPETGRITLQARHEGGAIVIEVADDGRGLPADKIRAKAVASGLASQAQADQMSDVDARQLIFLPGFSTAAAVTSVSGRGVGMDVVRTNIEKIGGAIELVSSEGAGTRFTIRIPLTLTIVSALIVECCGERFAMPQSSVIELVSASGASSRTIEYIDGAAVIRLRDRLLPLISLQSMLGLEPVADPAPETCIVVAKVGAFTFGVIVDRVFDTEEIVVKPVATVLRHLKFYSGATIMGDGSVILILDFKGISIEAGAGQGATGMQPEAEADVSAEQEKSALLVFRADDNSLKAAPLSSVLRIEELAANQIELVNGRTVMQYRGKLMPIIGADGRSAKVWDGEDSRPLLVFSRNDRSVGLLVSEIVDIVECVVALDESSARPGSAGSLIVNGAATEMIDVQYCCRQALNEPSEGAAPFRAATEAAPAPATVRKLLLIDQSPFAQLLLRPLLSQAGYDVTVAPGAEAALAMHEQGESFSLIMADTSDSEASRAFATTLAKANRWHATPLLSLAMTNALIREPSAAAAPSDLLDVVASALGEMRGAA